MRVGMGYDVHKLVEGRDLILGGVKIPYEKGLLGHSDADVLLHAIMDALLGAAALGDIGKHFPDTDPAYKGASSIRLLEEVGRMIDEKLYVIGNIDATLIAQRPKKAPHNHRTEAKTSSTHRSGHQKCGRCTGTFRRSGEYQGNDRRRTWFYWNGRRDFFTGNCKSGYDR